MSPLQTFKSRSASSASVAWNCLPSCIGSLPHTDPAAAVDLILDKLSAIPFWPQLPRRGFQENMYVQYATRLPGVTVDREKKRATVDLSSYDPEAIYTSILSEDVDAFAFPREHFSGFYELMSRAMPDTVQAVKGQVTGPVSLGLQMTDQDDRPVIYDEAYAEIIRRNLNLMARWQERELRRKCSRVITFVDEPYLSLIGTPFASVAPADAVRWIDEVLSGLEGKKGLHCCANTDWPTVMSMGVDILSFDAYDYGHTISLYPEEVARFLERGGTIAWGIIPNHEETLARESVGSLVERVEGLFRDLSAKGISEELVVTHSLLTPQCGLSGLEEDVAAAVLDRLAAVSKELRARRSLS